MGILQEVIKEHACRECCCSPCQGHICCFCHCGTYPCVWRKRTEVGPILVSGGRGQRSSVSWLSSCYLARGEHFPLRVDLLLLVESGAWGDKAPEFLPLVLHDSSSLQEELSVFSPM